jgi:hypothetical protein
MTLNCCSSTRANLIAVRGRPVNRCFCRRPYSQDDAEVIMKDLFDPPHCRTLSSVSHNQMTFDICDTYDTVSQL